MIEVEVRGGLGDAFITLHETMAYERLEKLGDGEAAEVGIISHNPFVDEIFKWHPNAGRIKIRKSRYFFLEYNDRGKRLDAGAFERAPEPQPPRERGPISFYPSSEDLRVIAAELPDRPYLAIAPTASGMEIENRNIPPGIVANICALACLRDIPVVFLGRTYQGPHAPKAAPTRPVDPPRIFDLTDKLSVPGTAEVVRRCRAIVSAHSALLLLSWYNRKPNFLLYPPKYKWHDFDHPSQFGFGKDYTETTRMLFKEFSPYKLNLFLSKNFTRETTP